MVVFIKISKSTVCSAESLKGAEQPSPQENSVFSGTPKWMQKEFSLAVAVVNYSERHENFYKNANKIKFKEIL